MRFAHNGEVETADFPPRPVGVPDHADIRFPDVMVGNPAGDLQAELIGVGCGRSQRQRTEQGTVKRAFCQTLFFFCMNTPELDSQKIRLAANAASRHFRDGLEIVLRRVLPNGGNTELSFVES